MDWDLAGGTNHDSGVPCAAVGFGIKAETFSCHGKWQSLEQRSRSEELGDIKRGWRSEKDHQLSNSASDMTSIPGSPSNATPIADNVPMDINSDSEAEQAAREFVQAQEWLCIANEAQERHQEEQKRQEEERKVKIVVAIKLAEELVVDRERRIQLQVSLEFHWL